MSPENLLLIGIAVLAVAAAVAAFAIAWRRSGGDWRGKVSAETRAADRMTGLDLPPVPVAEVDEPSLAPLRGGMEMAEPSEDPELET
ncbi:MAG: hypothetical protein WEA76_07260, partial [Acidimicrobiia bacterium]